MEGEGEVDGAGEVIGEVAMVFLTGIGLGVGRHWEGAVDDSAEALTAFPTCCSLAANRATLGSFLLGL